jgi:hypothetical protein
MSINWASFSKDLLTWSSAASAFLGALGSQDLV